MKNCENMYEGNEDEDKDAEWDEERKDEDEDWANEEKH